MPTEEKTIYIETVGRRKTSIARVRVTPAAKAACAVNGKDVNSYFPTEELRSTALEAVAVAKLAQKFKINAKIIGGGLNSQAEALRHGIARAIIIHDSGLRKKIKRAGFLKRDPRMKERRKFGLKKARKAPQWSKR